MDNGEWKFRGLLNSTYKLVFFRVLVLCLSSINCNTYATNNKIHIFNFICMIGSYMLSFQCTVAFLCQVVVEIELEPSKFLPAIFKAFAGGMGVPLL